MPTLAMVEDDPFASTIIRTIAAQQGWTSVLFEDVSEVLEHGKLNVFDLALVDVITPHSDAFELIAMLARTRMNVPLVPTSVHTEYLRLAATLAEAHRVDFRSSLTKPLLIPEIKSILGQSD